VSLRFSVEGNGVTTDPVSIPAGGQKTIQTQYSLSNTGGQLEGGDTVTATVGIVSGNTTIKTTPCGNIQIESTDDGGSDNGGSDSGSGDGTNGGDGGGSDGGDTGGGDNNGGQGGNGGSDIPQEGRIIDGVSNKVTLAAGAGVGLILLDRITD
jgi:hypothetical protein